METKEPDWATVELCPVRGGSPRRYKNSRGYATSYGCAATATTAGTAQGIGITGCAKHFVEGLRSGAELRRVGLTDRDSTGLPFSIHDERRVVRDIVPKGLRAECGADTGGNEQILVCDRQAMECTDGVIPG